MEEKVMQLLLTMICMAQSMTNSIECSRQNQSFDNLKI